MYMYIILKNSKHKNNNANLVMKKCPRQEKSSHTTGISSFKLKVKRISFCFKKNPLAGNKILLHQNL